MFDSQPGLVVENLKLLVHIYSFIQTNEPDTAPVNGTPILSHLSEFCLQIFCYAKLPQQADS